MSDVLLRAGAVINRYPPGRRQRRISAIKASGFRRCQDEDREDASERRVREAEGALTSCT